MSTRLRTVRVRARLIVVPGVLEGRQWSMLRGTQPLERFDEGFKMDSR